MTPLGDPNYKAYVQYILQLKDKLKQEFATASDHLLDELGNPAFANLTRNDPQILNIWDGTFDMHLTAIDP